MIARIGKISIACLLILPLLLGACGRKGDLQPPEGEKSAYTGLGTYPAPDSVVPQESAPSAAPEAKSGEEDDSSP
jgi:predicted small lipoprotein YifL